MLPDIALVLAASGLIVVHRRGVLADRGANRLLDGWGFAVGLAVALIAVTPVVEAAAARSFVSHMAQHQVLLLVAAPLIAASLPLRSLWVGATGRPWRSEARFGGPAAWAIPAALVAVAVVLAWHVPMFYDLAMARSSVHSFEHATLFGSAVGLWATVMHAAEDRRRLGSAVIALAGTAIVGAGLGVVLLTAPRPLYAAYVAGGAVALEQQQVGGALMKVGALLVHAGAAVGITLRWLHRFDDSPASASSR
ncbi:MAG: cytochrome c oxidase assembly protein [Actinobacteria bacterium]|jgi:cytochrome c oxidase assembly factor CtaG|nr:cytochrome c oxidase assembly protein [Actinomycetota bacterium]